MVADLTNPSQLQNRESRIVGFGNALAYLRVEATLDGGTLRFQVYGLQSNTNYTLLLDDDVMQTVNADQNGTAVFLVSVTDPTDLLGVVECKIEDSDGNIVFLSVL
jgi:hypothetical protein